MSLTPEEIAATARRIHDFIDAVNEGPGYPCHLAGASAADVPGLLAEVERLNGLHAAALRKAAERETERDEAQRMLANAQARVNEMQEKLRQAEQTIGAKEADARHSHNEALAAIELRQHESAAADRLRNERDEARSTLDGAVKAALKIAKEERDEADRRGWHRGWDDAVKRQVEFENRISHFIPERYEANYNALEDWITDAAQVIAAALHLHKFGVLGPFPALSAAVEKIYPELADDSRSAAVQNLSGIDTATDPGTSLSKVDTADRGEPSMVVVDGREALAYVIIRPGKGETGVSIEAAARGLGKPQAAYVLRHLANQWDPK